MHDLLEGAIPYEPKNMLTYFVTNKYFTLEQLNERLLNYEFGHTEIADKPSVLHDIKPEGSLRQLTAQMWLLTTVLLLLIGDLISESSEHWYCFLLLKICSIAAAREIKHSSIEYLSVIVEEHHELFKKLTR